MYSVEILVNDKPVTQYKHKGKVYIEGRKNSNYKIRLVNDSYQRVLMVVSVDGLSIQDGKPCGNESDGFLVNARSHWDIPGWMLDNKEAASFKFGAKGASYASDKGPEAIKNTGVIGVLVFTEKQEAGLNNVWPCFTWNPYPYVSPPRDPYWYGGSGHYTYGASDIKYQMNNCVVGSAIPVNTNNSLRSSGVCGQSMEAFACATSEVGSMGTAFGEATSFNTINVDFKRSSTVPVSTFIIYYDEVKVLNSMGIIMDWQEKSRHKKEAAPNPFPAGYCAPPKGWKK